MIGEAAVLFTNILIYTLFATTVGFGVAWMRASQRARRAESSRERLPQDAESRFDRLQQAVEAIALEVERISEAQRFTTKLLAERAAAELPRVPERVITPH
jgi:hypothetical protein